MTEQDNPLTKTEFLLYRTEGGKVRIETRMENETVWLTQAQMCELFDKNKRTISEHIRNVFFEGELQEEQVVRKFRTTAAEFEDFLKLSGRDILSHAGKISHENALEKAHLEYEKYRRAKLTESTEVENHFVNAEKKIKKLESTRKRRNKKE
jgi:hypothetical protein